MRSAEVRNPRERARCRLSLRDKAVDETNRMLFQVTKLLHQNLVTLLRSEVYQTPETILHESQVVAWALLLQDKECQEEEQCLSKRYSNGQRLAFGRC